MDTVGQKQWLIDVKRGSEGKRVGEINLETKHVPDTAGNPPTTDT